MPALAYRTTLPHPDDPDILQRVADATRKGHPLATAARLAGIGASTAQEWRATGNAMLQAHPFTPPGELGSHALFADAINQAEAEMVDAKLDEVNRDAALPGKGWTAAMTLLERRRPQDFARRTNVQVDQRTVSVNLTLPPAPEAELLQLVRARLEAGGTPLLPETTTAPPPPEST